MDFERTGLRASHFSGIAKKKIKSLETNIGYGSLSALESERRLDPAQAAEKLRKIEAATKTGASLADILEEDDN